MHRIDLDTPNSKQRRPRPRRVAVPSGQQLSLFDSTPTEDVMEADITQWLTGFESKNGFSDIKQSNTDRYLSGQEERIIP